MYLPQTALRTSHVRQGLVAEVAVAATLAAMKPVVLRVKVVLRATAVRKVLTTGVTMRVRNAPVMHRIAGALGCCGGCDEAISTAPMEQKTVVNRRLEQFVLPAGSGTLRLGRCRAGVVSHVGTSFRMC